MSEKFLHGVEVVEISDGPRPIRTVRSSVVGVVGTAPNAQQEVKASTQIGVVANNNALTFTSKLAGEIGNSSSIRLVNPNANSATLSVSVSGRDVAVNLATDSSGAITTTAAQVKTAVEANTTANALFTITNTGASTGAGVVTAQRRAALAGGLDDVFPLNTPILVPGDASMAAKLGLTGTLPAALDGIFDQTGAVVIVVRVAEGVDDEATISNVIGGVNVTTGAYEGVHAFLGSESTNGFCPRILCAPGFTSARTDFANPVVAEMVGIAERLRAVVIADGPNTTDAQAITYRGDWGSKRVYIVDPAVKVRNALGEIVDQPASARVAGLIAKIDNDLGFWWSPSNKVINGIVGTGRDIDFTLGDANSRANLLNEQEVATIIRQDGYRLWGNRTASDDPKFAFLSVVRTADMINDSILRAHMWAVDRNITRTYLEDVAQGVNDYLDRLKAQGAILGGRCFPSPGLNTPSSIADGKVFFDFEFTPPFPAEHITFRSKLVNDYIEEIL
jgi:phage tail sheath protein FI